MRPCAAISEAAWIRGSFPDLLPRHRHREGAGSRCRGERAGGTHPGPYPRIRRSAGRRHRVSGGRGQSALDSRTERRGGPGGRRHRLTGRARRAPAPVLRRRAVHDRRADGIRAGAADCRWRGVQLADEADLESQARLCGEWRWHADARQPMQGRHIARVRKAHCVTLVTRVLQW